MTVLHQTTVLALVSSLCACGDNAVPCDPTTSDTNWQIPYCLTSLVLAARDTADLLPSQAEVNRYLDRLRRAAEIEPLVEQQGAQRYRGTSGRITIYTTNPAIVDAWGRSEIHTGDPILDAALKRIGATVFVPPKDNGPYFVASLNVGAIFSEEYLATLLSERASWIDEPYVHHRGDIVWTWADGSRTGSDDATAQIDASFGWGDCFVSCLGLRYLRAIVPPEGPATVYDMGGDPLPEWITLDPRTKPFPGS
jgi:hypothetical protein